MYVFDSVVLSHGKTFAETRLRDSLSQVSVDVLDIPKRIPKRARNCVQVDCY